MSSLVLDEFADVAAWHTRQPNGADSTPADDDGGGPVRLPGLTTAGATLRATTQALGHHAERTGPAIDLRGCDDPLLWVPTTGSPTGKPPVRCSSRCASAGGLAIGDAANTWQRFVPIERAGTWQPVWPALDDLPSVVHEAGGRRGQVHRLVALVPGEVADQ